MKPSRTEGFNRPFDGLKELLRRKGKAIQPDPSTPRADSRLALPEVSDGEAFAEAMAGVTRINREHIGDERMPLPACPANAGLEEDVGPLRRLIENGSGFEVYHTPEYIEGVSHRAPPDITQRLHRGDFAVQAHLDLHGHMVDTARDLFDAFMRQSIIDGKNGILIIHGRGLSSPGDPVLKTKVAHWLRSGPWNKWVVAFASARMCDGGSGATYVLLRRRPLAKRQRKAKG